MQVSSDCHVRWLIRRDMPEVMRIENESFEFPWSEDDFIRCLRQRNCIGMVAELGDRVAGYIIYELHPSRLHILSIAVGTGDRNQGVASSIIRKIQRKLNQKRNRVLVEVRESNLMAQLFFKSNGFRAIKVLRDFYEDVVEDAYLMEYRP